MGLRERASPGPPPEPPAPATSFALSWRASVTVPSTSEHIFRGMRDDGFEPKEIVAVGICPDVQEAKEVVRAERGMEPEAVVREEYEYYADEYV